MTLSDLVPVQLRSRTQAQIGSSWTPPTMPSRYDELDVAVWLQTKYSDDRDIAYIRDNSQDPLMVAAAADVLAMRQRLEAKKLSSGDKFL